MWVGSSEIVCVQPAIKAAGAVFVTDHDVNLNPPNVMGSVACLQLVWSIDETPMMFLAQVSCHHAAQQLIEISLDRDCVLELHTWQNRTQ